MTVPRSELVDLEVTPYYHCISRCVRRARLCGDGFEYRKQWIEDRLELLASIFAVSVSSFSVLDNHLHVVLRLEGTELTETWSDREVAERWALLYPPRDKKRQPLADSDEWIRQKLKDKAWVTRTRKRLAKLGWFMKCLKEPLARMANAEDGTKGHFWEGRYKSIAILDDEALLATCAYVDLNPVSAGLSQMPDKSDHTSIKARVEHCRKLGRAKELESAMEKAAAGRTLSSTEASRLEEELWLCPFSDVPDNQETPSWRRGMLSGFSLAQYVRLVESTGRIVRDGKASIGAEVSSLLERLGTTADVWKETLKTLFSKDRQLGVAFAFSREHLKTAAAHRGRHHLANLNGCRA